MRQFWIAICVAALGFLPACTAYQTEESAPTVSYNYSDDDAYTEVAQKADDYCEENYGKDARLLDRDSSGSTYKATFSCE